MNLLQSPFKQLKSSIPMIGMILIVSAIIMGVVVIIHYWKDVSFGRLTRDPNAISELPAYIGFLSQLGIFFWAASAAICFFSSTIIASKSVHQQFKSFLLFSAIFSLYLGLDDVFILHETVLPHSVGIPEIFVYGIYAVLLFLYLIKFFQIILKTEYVLLLFALFCFGVSILIDLLEPPLINLFFFEDGSKLVGQISWLVYFYRASKYSVNLDAPQ